MKDIISTLVLPIVVASIVSFATSYSGLLKGDTISQIRLEKLDTEVSNTRTCIDSLAKDVNRNRLEMIDVKQKADRTADAFDKMERTLNDVGRVMSDVAIALGRMDERLKTIERKQGR